MSKFKISNEEKGKRLDEVIFARGFCLSRSKAQALIKKGNAKVNGKMEKPHYWVEEGDEIEIIPLEEEPILPKGEDIPLDVVYEDDSLLVINKPTGLVVHPGSGNKEGTLVNALVHRYGTLAGDVFRPGIVHRIDKDTSGLLVIAKTEEALLFLQSQLADHSMHREYMALVDGIILEDDGKIDAPIGRDLSKPTQNTVDVKKGKEAITYFHVEKRFPNANATLISCRLLTGRTHQIRVHMDYIGHPVIGDLTYGRGNRKLYDKGQLLHAYRLTFVHPKTKEEVSFSSPLPEYFSKLLDSLN